jgi:hypothetical protein
MSSPWMSYEQELLMEVLKVHGKDQMTSPRAREEADGFFEPPTAMETFLSKFPSLNPFMAFHLSHLPFSLKELINLLCTSPLDLARFPAHLPSQALRNLAVDLAWGTRHWITDANAIPAYVPNVCDKRTAHGGLEWVPQPCIHREPLVPMGNAFPGYQCS